MTTIVFFSSSFDNFIFCSQKNKVKTRIPSVVIVTF